MDTYVLIEEKLKATQKDVDNMRDDMDALDSKVSTISDTLIGISARQDEILKGLQSVISNGGTPRCHERQVVIDNLMKANAVCSTQLDLLSRSVILLESKVTNNVGIQKWTLEIAKTIVLGVVISLLISALNTSTHKIEDKGSSQHSADKAVQI